MNEQVIQKIKLSTHYVLECFKKDGTLRWRAEFDNLVVTEGLNDALDKHFKANAYTAAWYVGLTGDTPVFAAADVMNNHAGWTEVTAYTQANRPALTLGAIANGAVNNSAAKASFSINADNTHIGGAFTTTSNTKGGNTGLLYGGGALSANRIMFNGDTLNVQVNLTVAAG